MTNTKIIVTMEDGSIFTMPDESWTKAFRIKYAGEEKEALSIFKETVAKHWREHTVPTKFGWDDEWEENYQDHASLGKDVMYVYIRTACSQSRWRNSQSTRERIGSQRSSE